MVYIVLGWGVVGGAYRKIQIVSYASAKITKLEHRLKNIDFMKWVGI